MSHVDTATRIPLTSNADGFATKWTFLHFDVSKNGGCGNAQYLWKASLTLGTKTTCLFGYCFANASTFFITICSNACLYVMLLVNAWLIFSSETNGPMRRTMDGFFDDASCKTSSKGSYIKSSLAVNGPEKSNISVFFWTSSFIFICCCCCCLK